MIDWRTLGHWQALEDAKKEAERKLEASVPPAAGTTPALGSREPAAPARPPLALFSLPPQGSGPAAGALLGHAVSPPAAAVVLAPLTLARLAAMLHKAQSTNPSGGSDNLGDLLLRCAAFARPTPLRAPLLGSPGFCGLCGFCGFSGFPGVFLAGSLRVRWLLWCSPGSLGSLQPSGAWGFRFACQGMSRGRVVRLCIRAG